MSSTFTFTTLAGRYISQRYYQVLVRPSCTDRTTEPRNQQYRPRIIEDLITKIFITSRDRLYFGTCCIYVHMASTAEGLLYQRDSRVILFFSSAFWADYNKTIKLHFLYLLLFNVYALSSQPMVYPLYPFFFIESVSLFSRGQIDFSIHF